MKRVGRVGRVLTALMLLLMTGLCGVWAWAATPVSAQAIDSYLQGRRLAGHGAAFIKWGSYFNVDPRLIVGIANAESTLGNSSCGTNSTGTWNAWGWFGGTGSCWTHFAPGLDSDTNRSEYSNAPSFVSGQGITMSTGFEDGIFWVTRSLRKDHLDAGRTTVDSIGSKYCAEGCMNWVPNVKATFTALGGDPNSLNFTATTNSAGGVAVVGSSWLGGQGVDAMDNGSNVNNDFGANYLSGVYVGEKWQCVELAQRLYTAKGWHSGSFGVSYAYQIYDRAPNIGMEHYPNGGGYVPVPGDLIIYSYGTTPGHVTVVDHVDSSHVYVVEQNWPNSGGRYTHSLSGSIINNRGSYIVRGFVHDPDNHNTNGGGGTNVTTVVSESDAAASNGAPGFWRWGSPNWKDVTSTGDGGHMLWTYTNGNSIDNMGDWRPNLPSAQRYEVFVWISSNFATTTKAHYEIYHAGTRDNVTVNQNNVSNAWVSLGTYSFNAGTDGYLRLTDGYTEPYNGNTKVGFDTAKWEPRGNPDTEPPTVTITSGHVNGGTYWGVQTLKWHIDEPGGSGIAGWGQAWDSDPGSNTYTTSDGYLDLPPGIHTLHVHTRDNAGNQRDWTFGPYGYKATGAYANGDRDSRIQGCADGFDADYIGVPVDNDGGWVHQALGNGSGDGLAQDYSGGLGTQGIVIAKNGAAAAYNVRGSIWQRYRDLGFAMSFLGFPTSNEDRLDAPSPDSPKGTKGWLSHFEGGNLYAGEGINVFSVIGAIKAKYVDTGDAVGPLGFPTSDEHDVTSSVSGATGRANSFEGGWVFYTSNPYWVYGNIAAQYNAANNCAGRYGLPISDPHDGPNGREQQFEGGTLYENPPAPAVCRLSGAVNIVSGGAAKGLASVTVVAVRASDKHKFSVVTSSAGAYTFTGLTAGSYTLSCTTPSFAYTYAPSPAQSQPLVLSATAPSRTGLNFTARPVVGGRVYNALAQLGLGGMSVRAVRNSDGTLAASVTSGPLGNYQLTLAPGSYTLSAVKPSDSRFRIAATFSQPVIVPDTVATRPVLNFRSVGITGRIVTSSNAPVSGVKVNLDNPRDPNHTVLRTSTTDSNGFFSLEGVAAGSFNITPVSPTTLSYTPRTRLIAIADKSVFTTFKAAPAPAAATQNAAEVSDVSLSKATLDATGYNVTLVFTGALQAESALNAARYSLEVNGAPVALHSVVLQGANTVVLSFEAGVVEAGDGVAVSWHDLRDGQDRSLSGQTVLAE